MSKNIVMKTWSGGDWVQVHPITKSDNIFFLDGYNLTQKMDTKSDVHSHPYRLNSWLPTPTEIGALDTGGGIIDGSLQVNGTITAANGMALKIGEGLEFLTQGDYFPGATYYDARIIRMVDTNGTGGNVDGGLVVEGYTPTDGVRQELLTARTNGEFKFKGNDIWHVGNFDPNSKQGSLGPTVDIQYRDATMYGNLIPDNTLLRSIGSNTKWIKEAWIESLHLGPNTLYIGDTPIIGTDQDNIFIQADLNQTITMKTSGVGETKIISERGVELSASGLNADVVIQSTGSGGRVTFGAHTSINYTAPDIYYNGRVTFSQGVIFNGDNVEINAEQVTTKDNIIQLNDGEVGSGVTAGQSGIRIDRGDLSDQVFLWDESKNSWCLGSVGGSLKMVATEDNISQLQTALDGKVDDSQVLTNVPAGAKFTDSTYSVGDGGLTEKNFTSVLKTKLDGVATGANKYVHPSTHQASMIVQSSSYRFVTDAEKSTWSGKSDAGHIHPIPTTPPIASLSLLEDGNKVDLSFAKLGVTVDHYEIYSSIGDETDYAMIGKLDHSVADPTVVFHDYTYDRNTQIFYKVIAVKNGIVSSETKANITVTNQVGDISNLKVTESTGTILVTYELPDDRRLKEVEVYIGSSSTTTVEKPASPYYKGPNNFSFYEVPDTDLDKNFKVWVDTITRI